MKTPLTARRVRIASAFLLLLGAVIVQPSHADVGLRVQSHPVSAPIDAYVRVTADGQSVTGLTPEDFEVTLDGRPFGQFALTLPPSQDSAQKVSVVIVIEEDRYFATPEYSALLDQLSVGDMVAVVKYWGDIESIRFGGLSVLPFTELDGGRRSERVANFIQRRPDLGRLGISQFLFNGLMEALSQFETASATLPDGSRAIVTVGCCGGREISLSDVVARANADGVAIFDIGFLAWARNRDLSAHMKALSTNTGGIQVPVSNGASAVDALPTMAAWLRDGYRISIPHDAISDCDRHTLAVTVGGESGSLPFSRCDTTPERFDFRDRLDAPLATRVRSNPVTITGIDTEVPIRVYGGEYSIGCGRTFTTEPGRIQPGESVCVRHVTQPSGGLEVYTLLIVGGVSGWFYSSTIFP